MPKIKDVHLARAFLLHHEIAEDITWGKEKERRPNSSCVRTLHSHYDKHTRDNTSIHS
jgi:hypothetical protein